MVKQVLGTLALGLAVGLPVADAHGLRSQPRATTAYYYPAAPVYYCPPGTVPVATYPTSVPPPPPPATSIPRPLAAPIAAPPSSTPPPPLAPAPRAGPRVSESRSYYDTYAVAPRASEVSPSGRCTIRFWNLSGQDLTLTVDQATQVLPNGKRVSLDLDRRFRWQVAGRQPEQESVAAGESALEIVIRR